MHVSSSNLSVAQKESKIGVPFFNETGYQSVHKICEPFTVKTRVDKIEEYDPPAMNEMQHFFVFVSLGHK
jgi:hypothetical protein